MPGPKKCCNCGGECDGCPCSLSDCFQIVDPPTLTLCATHPIAMGVANVAIAGVMQYRPENEGMDECAWWNHYCAPFTDENYTAYSLEMYLDDFCKMRLAFWVACNLTKEECCGLGIRPPHKNAESDPRWHRIVLYRRALFDSAACGDESPITFDKLLGSAGCQAECESFGGMSASQFPDSIDVVGLPVCDSPPGLGGTGCEEEEPNECCDLNIDYPTPLYASISSSCPVFDGLTLQLDKYAFGDWWWVLAYGYDPMTGDGTLCGTKCAIRMVLQCSIDGITGIRYWSLDTVLQCDVTSGISKGCRTEAAEVGEDPISQECDPLSVVFEQTLTMGVGCGTCASCTLVITITK